MSLPEPFGWRTSWIAVRSINTELLVPELQLIGIRSSEWEEGLREAGENGIFISPPVSGWTLIVALTLPDASDDDALPLLVRLSETHQSAQYFANHRVVDYYAWAKAERGRLLRAYAFVGDQGVTPWDRGELTKEELELGMVFDESFNLTTTRDAPAQSEQRTHSSRRKYPDEHDVFAIARKWSVDPTQIEEYEASEAPGVLGYRDPRG